MREIPRDLLGYLQDNNWEGYVGRLTSLLESHSGVERTGLIESALVNLGAIEMAREISPVVGDDLVTQIGDARRAVRDFFEPVRDKFLDLGAVPGYYGSLQYGDPRNFDLDIVVPVDFRPDRPGNYARVQELTGGLLPGLQDMWSAHKLRPLAEPHVTVVSPVEILLADTHIADERFHLVDTLPADISLILSCRPVFERDKQSLASMRHFTLNLLEGSSLVQAGVVVELERVVEVRNSRIKP